MKFFKPILFFIFLLVSVQSHAKVKVTVEYVNRDLLEYSYPVIFKNLPAKLAEFTPYFQAIAFVIILTALGFAFLNATESRSYLSAVVLAGVLSTIIATSGLFIQLGLDTVHSLNKGLRVDSPYTIAHRLYNAALHFQDPSIKSEDRNAVMEKRVMAGCEAGDQKIGAISFWKDPIGYINYGIKSLVGFFISMVIHLLLHLCALFMVCVETIRYFLIRCGALILPVFIAGLMTKNFRAQSITYIFSLIGILCWPIGWSLGHIGTVALYDSILQIISGTLTTDSHLADNVIEELSTVDNPFAHVSIVGGWIAVATVGNLLCLLGMFLGIVLWVLLVTLSAPFLIQRCVSSGAQFFTGLAGGAAQGVARAVGGGASYAMVRSARSTAMGENGERPQPSSGMRAAFAASRTMMNASRFQGDPSQFSQIGDTGIDELRQYRAEAAQVDIARSKASKKSAWEWTPKDEEKSMRESAKKAAENVKSRADMKDKG